jgi:hypothetical protein
LDRQRLRPPAGEFRRVYSPCFAIFGLARTKADQLLRLADSMQRVCFGHNSAAILAAPLLADRDAPAVQSNILAAKAKPISDKKSLFDTVPLLNPFFVAPLGI